jgi:hypothetical protein
MRKSSFEFRVQSFERDSIRIYTVASNDFRGDGILIIYKIMDYAAEN